MMYNYYREIIIVVIESCDFFFKKHHSYKEGSLIFGNGARAKGGYEEWSRGMSQLISSTTELYTSTRNRKIMVTS